MKLYELKKWTKVYINREEYTFLWIDWFYWKWKNKEWEMVIVYNANQEVIEKENKYFIN